MHRDGFICATAGNRHTTNGTNHLLVLSGGSALRVFAVYPAEEQGENRGRRRGRVGTRKRARHKKEPSDCWMERNKNNRNAVNAVRLQTRRVNGARRLLAIASPSLRTDVNGWISFTPLESQ